MNSLHLNSFNSLILSWQREGISIFIVSGNREHDYKLNHEQEEKSVKRLAYRLDI